MEPKTQGLHHITAITSDASSAVNFYTRILGLRLVKKTVNFDDPSAYHLYFGDEKGNHGHGATTRALTTPLSTSFRNRVSTKIPCVGRAALGYKVLKVRIRTLRPQDRARQH